eukprot:261713-Prymnesium_polylepis.1
MVPLTSYAASTTRSSSGRLPIISNFIKVSRQSANPTDKANHPRPHTRQWTRTRNSPGLLESEKRYRN